MLTVFSNLLPKVSETGRTVKQHSQKKFIKNGPSKSFTTVTFLIVNRFSSYKIASFFFTDNVNLDRNETFL